MVEYLVIGEFSCKGKASV